MPAAISLPGNISNILSSLLKAGVVSATGTPSNSGDAPQAIEPQENTETHRKEASRSYRNAILDRQVQLSTLGITRYVLKFFLIIGQWLTIMLDLALTSRKCYTAACRSSAGSVELVTPTRNLGKRIWKSISTRTSGKIVKPTRIAVEGTVGAGLSRWRYVTSIINERLTNKFIFQDWVNDNVNLKGKGNANAPGSSGSDTNTSIEDAAKRDAELRAQFVVVPSGDESKTISCPICKEVLRSEWLDDDEDWVWRNAVRKDDKVAVFETVLEKYLY
jgi:pre-mRNA cleavage complex 2 protein Pcf11